MDFFELEESSEKMFDLLKEKIDDA
jgi:hypothetical protein